jgi:LAS superfamily LD-carboxypeptidase LdcB
VSPLRRASTVLALAALVPLLPVPTGAQAADPLAQARREAAAVRAEVERTARVLSEGSRRLEREQAALGKVRRQLDQARREAGSAQAQSDEARTRLRALAVAAYRSPVPDGLALALTGTPDRFVDAMVARADRARAQGSTTEVLREATAARVKAQGAVRSVEQLTAEASAQERALAERVKALQSQADRAAKRLADASSRLQGAQRRATRSRATSVVATCDGGSTGGAANGFLDRSALCPLDGAPGHALRADAAAAFNRMTAAALADRGARLCVNDSYRSYAGQVSVFRRKPRLAAVPGTSRHGLGVAVDLGCGGERFGSSTYRWLKANAGRFGWVHPAWAEPGGALPEPWHWEYAG